MTQSANRQTAKASGETAKWDDRETPVLSSLIETAARHKLSLHVPGHKQGRLLPSVLAVWLGHALQLDMTELPGLDNLHHPQGCIETSQDLAARHYGAKMTLYSVNGSSAGVMAAMLALAPGQAVLVAQGFHHSLWKGLVLAGATPVLLPTRFDDRTLEVIPPGPADIQAALATHPEVTAVFVTAPNYQGRTADVEALASVCHERGLPLIVDEAHGAHFGLTRALPRNSVQAGADVVIQSVHKMLPALTQTAWVHVQGELVDTNRLREALLTLQTSSPSYLLMASLDVAQAWLRLEGAAVTTRSLAVLNSYDELVQEPLRDPFRKWIPTGSLLASQTIEMALRELGVMVEYADHLGVLLVFGLDVQRRDIERWLPVLRQAEESSRQQKSRVADPVFERLPALADPRPVLLSPREVEFARRERVPLEQCAHRIAATSITPYPPGVPVIYPGQQIGVDAARYLQALCESGYQTLGLDSDGTIQVLCE